MIPCALFIARKSTMTCHLSCASDTNHDIERGLENIHSSSQGEVPRRSRKVIVSYESSDPQSVALECVTVASPGTCQIHIQGVVPDLLNCNSGV